MSKLIFGLLNTIKNEVDRQLCGMVNYTRSPNLENRISVQKASTKEVLSMAKHRLRVCIGYNADGSEVIKRISANSETELADQAVKAVLNSERRDEFLAGLGLLGAGVNKQSSMTFEKYAEEWLATYKAGKLRPTTFDSYKQLLRAYLYPAFGELSLIDISTKAIQEVLNEHKHLSKRTLQYILTLLRAILQSAKKDGLIDINPADDERLSIPSDKVAKRKALTLDEVRDIIDGVKHLTDENDRRFIGLLLYTGMRRGEVLGLKWEDVDFQGGYLHVRRNVTYPNGANQPTIGKPKSDSGIRDIPLTRQVMELLVPSKESGFIIGDGTTPITLSSVRRRSERLRKQINLHGATPHVFRHSYATLLNDAGADVKTIQSIIGDSDFKTVADRYCHPRDDKKIEAVKAVSELLG